MTNNKPNVIIFDCDGVLIDSEIISAQTLRTEALEWGMDISIEHILENYVGRSFPTVFKQMQSKFDAPFLEDFEARYRARLLQAFTNELCEMAGVRYVLDNLKTPFCVATSSSTARVEVSLKLTRLRNYFGDRVFTASLVKNGKPAPDLFLYVAEKMGVHPKNCVVIEDSEMGVQAGLAAGMTTLRFTGGGHIHHKNDPAGAHMVLKKFIDFFEYFPDFASKGRVSY